MPTTKVSGEDLTKSVLAATPQAMQVLSDAGVTLSSSLQEIMPPVITNPFAFNAFITNVYNKIIMTEIINGVFRNPLEPLKKGALVPFGDTVERMVFNPAKAINYFNTEDNILTPVKPDVKVEYIRINRQDKYPVSLPRPVVEQAFMSSTSAGEFYIGARNSLYNGDAIDEFRLMLKIVVDMYNSNYIVKEEIGSTAVDFTKQLINIAKIFRFPNTKYSQYSVQHPDDALTTWVNPEDIVVVIRSDYMTNVKVDVLSAAFNLTEIELGSNIIEVDQFGNTDVVAVVCDRSYFQVRDSLYELADFYRADDLSTKSYLHHWQTMTCSLFAKAVAIHDPSLLG